MCKRDEARDHPIQRHQLRLGDSRVMERVHQGSKGEKEWIAPDLFVQAEIDLAASGSQRRRRVGDPEVVPASRYGECALNIGDTDVADIIMGHLHGDPAENHATLAASAKGFAIASSQSYADI